jgi:hypothetical protein
MRVSLLADIKALRKLLLLLKSLQEFNYKAGFLLVLESIIS